MNNQTFKEEAKLEEDITEEAEEERRRRFIVLILFFIFLFLIMFAMMFTRSNPDRDYVYDYHALVSKYDETGFCILNCDYDNNGSIESNIDTDNDGIADINITYGRNTTPIFNLTDDLETGRPETNLINQTDENGTCILNCDTDGNHKPVTNVDLDGDSVCDLNCKNGTVNIDNDYDTLCNYNCDTDGDGEADMNIGDDTTMPQIDVNRKGPYEIEFSRLVGNYMVVPGWSAENSFTVYNSSTKTLYYNIRFTDVVNTYNRNDLYYSLTRDGRSLINSENLPRADVNMLERVQILPGATHSYTISFEYRDTQTNQDIDQDSYFDTTIQVYSTYNNE